MRALFIFIVLFTTATCAAADRFTVTDLRNAVAARDFDLVNESLDTAQSEFLAGERSADNMRALFIVLSRSAPETVQFVKDWLARDTDNPKAQIARAWSIYGAAGNIERGRNIYSQEIVRHMRRERHRLATAAYQNAPYLIPASDAIVRNEGSVEGADVHPLEVMNGVLMAHPNWGTIKRTIETGYLYYKPTSLVISFCNTAAGHFPAVERVIIEHRCMMKVGAAQGRPLLEHYVRKHLWTDQDPETALNRLKFFIRTADLSKATEYQLGWAEKTLMTHPVDQFGLWYLDVLARDLQNALWKQNKVQSKLSLRFRQTRLAEIERYLEGDPYNLDLVDMIEDVAFQPRLQRTEKADGRVSWEPEKVIRTKEQQAVFDAARVEQKHEIILKRLRAAPYRSKGWLNFAAYAHNRNLPHSFFDGDGAYQNAVVFAEDPADVLDSFTYYLAYLWDTAHRFDGVSPNQLDHPAEWRAFFADKDIEKRIVCPFLRARLLLKSICEAYPADAPQCELSNYPQSGSLGDLTNIAMKTASCAYLLDQRIEEMWYTPIPYNKAVSDIDGS